MPLVAVGEVPGNEIEHPMVAVILGGLISSSLVNLFVVPAPYPAGVVIGKEGEAALYVAP